MSDKRVKAGGRVYVHRRCRACQQQVQREAVARRRQAAREGNDDWTIDPETHRSNSSPEYLRLVFEVDRLIRGSAFSLINGQSESVAGLIVAQLAHVYGLRPTRITTDALTDAKKEID